MSIASCKRCGKLFQKVSSDLCPECVRKDEAAFEEIKHYLRDHDNASVEEVAKALDIEEEVIVRFLREGRLIAQKKMSYPCLSCGKPITSGKYCPECREKMADAVGNIKESLSAEQGKRTRPGYFSQTDDN